MTAGELADAIAGLPADAEVRIACDECCTQAGAKLVEYKRDVPGWPDAVVIS